MGKVIYDISMSLDGFISGANARPEAGWAGLGFIVNFRGSDSGRGILSR